jgi:hypothetical protein
MHMGRPDVQTFEYLAKNIRIRSDMTVDKHPILRPTEQTRLILAAALVATAIAAVQILPDFKNDAVEVFLKGVLVISAFSGFMFILLTAAMLKYSKADEVGSWPFTEKFRTKCYDYCIDSYGIQSGSIIMFGFAYVLGWTFEKDVWDWRVGGGVLVTTLLFAFIVRKVRHQKNQ